MKALYLMRNCNLFVAILMHIIVGRKIGRDRHRDDFPYRGNISSHLSELERWLNDFS